jgi:hypothetical protein
MRSATAQEFAYGIGGGIEVDDVTGGVPAVAAVDH